MKATTDTRSLFAMNCATEGISTVPATSSTMEREDLKRRHGREVRRLARRLRAIARHKGAEEERADMIESVAEHVLGRMLRDCADGFEGARFSDKLGVEAATELIVQLGIMAGLGLEDLQGSFEDVFHLDFLPTGQKDLRGGSIVYHAGDYDPLFSPWVAAVFRAVFDRLGIDTDSPDFPTRSTPVM